MAKPVLFVASATRVIPTSITTAFSFTMSAFKNSGKPNAATIISACKQNSFKFFDSYGVLYLVGKTVYYKTTETAIPMEFNLDDCSVQQEPDWKLLKWFSITTPPGEKFYFNSHKMGVLKSNSGETLKGLAVIKAKMAS